MRANRLITAMMFAFLCAFLSGCATTSYRLGISGFQDAASTAGRSYWLLSAMKGVSTDDLEFREYAAYLKRGLAEAGFTEAPSFEKSDLAIFVSYGIGDTKEQHYSYSLPIYGQVGGGTYNYSGTSYSRYGSTTTYGTMTKQSQFGVVGSQEISGTRTTHLRYLFLDALDLNSYRTQKKTVSVWRTDVVSRGTSSDLRQVFPVMVVAAAPHLGKDTKKQVIVNISEGDRRLRQMRDGNAK